MVYQLEIILGLVYFIIMIFIVLNEVNQFPPQQQKLAWILGLLWPIWLVVLVVLVAFGFFRRLMQKGQDQ